MDPQALRAIELQHEQRAEALKQELERERASHDRMGRELEVALLRSSGLLRRLEAAEAARFELEVELRKLRRAVLTLREIDADADKAMQRLEVHTTPSQQLDLFGDGA